MDMNVCRVCMAREGTNKLMNIFDWKGKIESTRLDVMLNECTNCDVKLEDALPKKICLRCVIAAQQAFKFKRMCEHNERFFCNQLNQKLIKSPENLKDGNPVDKIESVKVRRAERKACIYEDASIITGDRLDMSDIDLSPVKIVQELSRKTMPEPVELEYEICESGNQTGNVAVTEYYSELYYTDDSGDKGLSISAEHLFKCPHCSKVFANNQQFKRHLSGHLDGRPHKCPHCLKDFTQSHHLKRHVCIHTGQLFKCPHCSNTFPLNHLLEEHKRVHAEKRPFQCPHCTKSFTQNSYLTSHIRTHQGERSFKCPCCPKSFGSNHILQAHIRGHKVERPYKCHCLKAFTQKCNLKVHQQRCPPAKTYGLKIIAESANQTVVEIQL